MNYNFKCLHMRSRDGSPSGAFESGHAPQKNSSNESNIKKTGREGKTGEFSESGLDWSIFSKSPRQVPTAFSGVWVLLPPPIRVCFHILDSLKVSLCGTWPDSKAPLGGRHAIWFEVQGFSPAPEALVVGSADLYLTRYKPLHTHLNSLSQFLLGSGVCCLHLSGSASIYSIH